MPRYLPQIQGFTSLDKAVINAFIKLIDVTPVSNDVVITFNFKDDYGRLTGLLAESGADSHVC